MRNLLDTLGAVGGRPIIGRIRVRTLFDAAIALWFSVISFTLVFGPALRGDPVNFGWDAVTYALAGQALLGGGDPWATSYSGIVFAAPPPSLLPYLPFAWLPDPVVRVAWVAIGAVSAVYAVRRLRLPWWWLTFPPLVFGVVAGSSAPLMLALLVRGGAVADAGAVVARVYAALPLLLLGRWRGLVLAAVVVLVTLPFLGWPMFIERWPEVSQTLRNQANGGLSATVSPVLFGIAVVALVALGPKKAAWLIVPALWPDTQLYYASIALPVLASMPLVALAIASPATPGLIALGMAAHAAIDWIRGRRPAATTTTAGPPSQTSPA